MDISFVIKDSIVLNLSSMSPTEFYPVFDEDKFLYGSLLALIFIIANTINGFTVLVFMKNRLLHTANNFLVVGLALSDWLHVVTGCLIPLLWLNTLEVTLLQSSWWLCVGIGYTTHTFYSISTNTLVLISFHRLVSIVFSQRKIIATMQSAKKVVMCLWFCTALTCLPGVFRERAYVYNPNLRTCALLAEDKGDLIFSVYSLIINFGIPLSLMMFFYYKIYRMVLHHKLSTVSETILTNGVIEKKSKRLIISVLSIFCCTWIPFYVTLMISSLSDHAIPSTVQVFIWPLKMSSSMSNPILYAVCNRLYFRCMIRLLRCNGPLRNTHRQSPLSKMTHRPSCYSSSNEIKDEDEISTIAPLPGQSYIPGGCEHCMHCREPLYSNRRNISAYVNNGTQTSRFSSELGTLQEGETSVTLGCRHSLCSHCTEYSTSLSARSSIPTIFQLPIQRFKRRGSASSSTSTHVFGPTPDAQYFTDSGRSSFASQFTTPPGYHSARTSYSSVFPNSNRTSLNSNYAHVGSTPGGSQSDIDMKRLPSFSSRQSFYSSLSMPRSTRSSVVSSRISHYAPMSTSFSARSSLTSQYTYGSTPFSTRPNTPQDLVLNTDVELVYLPRDTSPGNKTTSTPSTRYSSDTTLTSEKMTNCRHISENCMDIYEDNEMEISDASPVSAKTSRSQLSPTTSEVDRKNSSPDSTCQRVSMFLLGDFDPGMELEDQNVGNKPRDLERMKKKRKSMLPKLTGLSPSPPSWSQYGDTSPRQAHRACNSTTPRIQSPRSPSPSPKQMCSKCERAVSPIPDGDWKGALCHSHEDVTHTLINSVGKAVNVVVKARRLRSKIQPLQQHKPDTPVPVTCSPPKESPKIPHVKEPIRFVYESFYPSNYYSAYGPRQMNPTKNTLRVPGRPPPLNVPQTIQEEDPPIEVVSPTPDTPTTPRRKNASSWINPPVIDVSNGDEDMRVECPGVLVEIHN